MTGLLTVVLGVGLFVGVILALVVLLLAAKRRLVAGGPVTLAINDDPARTRTVAAGASLLQTLAAQEIYLPSACGGRGTCGVCRCQVTAGGGTLLPVERGRFTRAEARAGMRLACQVKVKQDLAINLPPSVFAIRRWTGTVRSNRSVATFIKELVLDLPAGETVPFQAGGYIQIECPPHVIHYRDLEIPPEYRADWDRLGLWDLTSTVREPVVRAYSMANHPGEAGIMLNVRIATPPPQPPGLPPGMMSTYLCHLRPGDPVTISGPYGEFFARDTDREMCFVGGGAGMAPMRSHILDQFLRRGTRRRVTFWYGARSRREAFYVEDFDRLAAAHPNFTWTLALSDPRPEDRWTGPTGFIHQVLADRYLAAHPEPEGIEYYLCGPPLMIAAVRRLLTSLGVEDRDVLFDDFGD